MTTGWEIATSIGTLLAVLVALFGYFAPRWIKPVLILKLDSDIGVLQDVAMSYVLPNRLGAKSQARYFHLRVTNQHRYPNAHHVRVLLHQVEKDSGAGWESLWEAGGGIPLTWQHQDFVGKERTVGPDAFADLMALVKLPSQSGAPEAGIHLGVAFEPVGFPRVHTGPSKLRFVVQAQSDEADSARMQISVTWDGRWSTEGLTIREGDA
jgi:hypothetical protein